MNKECCKKCNSDYTGKDVCMMPSCICHTVTVENKLPNPEDDGFEAVGNKVSAPTSEEKECGCVPIGIEGKIPRYCAKHLAEHVSAPTSNGIEEVMKEFEDKIIEFAQCDSHGYMCSECKNDPEKIKDFLRVQLHAVADKARNEALTELPSITGEKGKLFSTVIAKAMTAPFPEVALQHIVMRVSEKYTEIGFEAALGEVSAKLTERAKHWQQIYKESMPANTLIGYHADSCLHVLSDLQSFLISLKKKQ